MNDDFKVSIDDEILELVSAKLLNKLKDRERILIAEATEKVISQLKTLGRRERTLHDYKKWVEHYQSVTAHSYVDQITATSIMSWLSSMDMLSQTTKNIRLKSFKAVLNRFHQNGWVDVRFWDDIQIKVDKVVKPCATIEDVEKLIHTLDLTNWFELRDAVAILLMFKTGIRLATMSQLREYHIDLDNHFLNLTSDIMKNHQPLKLPIDDITCELIRTLKTANKKILKKNNIRSSLLFITKNGEAVQSTFNNNVIQKRIAKYASVAQVENINPHALRRGFATNLMNSGASVALISKALGHSSLEVTTQYLYLSREEVALNLRQYL